MESRGEQFISIQFRLADFARSLVELPERHSYDRSDLLKSPFLLATEGRLAVYYAPFDHINRDAQVAIVGITPGWTQAEIAFRVARRELIQGSTLELASRKAKLAASFAGSMRRNLVRMLDELKLPELLDIGASDDLFGSASNLCHMTSVFRYPVFYLGRNYTGSTPSPDKSSLLMQMARKIIVPELNCLQDCAIVPLGRSVDLVLSILEDEGLLDRGRRLIGFPHPSGANGHRQRQFTEQRTFLQEVLRDVLVQRRRTSFLGA